MRLKATITVTDFICSDIDLLKSNYCLRYESRLALVLRLNIPKVYETSLFRMTFKPVFG